MTALRFQTRGRHPRTPFRGTQTTLPTCLKHVGGSDYATSIGLDCTECSIVLIDTCYTTSLHVSSDRMHNKVKRFALKKHITSAFYIEEIYNI